MVLTSKQRLYEYNERAFHWHPDCTEGRDQVGFENFTMKEAYEQLEERKEYLKRHGCSEEVKCSCE